MKHSMLSLFAFFLQPWLFCTLFEGEEGGGEGAGEGGHWSDGLSDEARGSDLFKPLEGKSIGEFWQDYEGKARMLGSRIPIPGEDASDEVRAEFNQKLAGVPGVMVMPDPDNAEAMGEFWNQLGRPEAATGYKITKPEQMPAGVDWSDDSLNGFLEQAHKIGLTQAQAQQLNDWHLQSLTEQAEAAGTAAQQGAAKVREAWGSAFDQNLGIARAALKSKFGDEAAEAYDHALQTDPVFAQMALTFGKASLEDSVVRGFGAGDGLTKTPEELDAEIAELSADPAYLDKTNPKHKSINAKVQALYQQRYPEQKTA